MSVDFESQEDDWRARHDRAVMHNVHVGHGVKNNLVQSSPTVIIMTVCPCGMAYTMTDGEFSSGNYRFFADMENRTMDEDPTYDPGAEQAMTPAEIADSPF